ncbi:MAG TPA: hypothetical protein DEO85_11500 [Maritimibacter sp.]|nr:hypothetical protein [Maritimibacter sp.]
MRPFHRKTGKPENRKTGKPENRKTGKPENRKTGKPENRKTGFGAVQANRPKVDTCGAWSFTSVHRPGRSERQPQTIASGIPGMCAPISLAGSVS